MHLSYYFTIFLPTSPSFLIHHLSYFLIFLTSSTFLLLHHSYSFCIFLTFASFFCFLITSKYLLLLFHLSYFCFFLTIASSLLILSYYSIFLTTFLLLLHLSYSLLHFCITSCCSPLFSAHPCKPSRSLIARHPDAWSLQKLHTIGPRGGGQLHNALGNAGNLHALWQTAQAQPPNPLQVKPSNKINHPLSIFPNGHRGSLTFSIG